MPDTLKGDWIMAHMESVWRSDRVRAFTASHVNDRIDQLTRASIEHLRDASRDVIIRRLTELDQEWDVERTLVASFAVLGGVSVELGRRSMFFRWVARSQMVFLFTHTLIGWCPPLPLFRRLTFRTTKEIQGEREELLAILRERGEPLASPLLDSLPPRNIPHGAQGKTRPGGPTGTP